MMLRSIGCGILTIKSRFKKLIVKKSKISDTLEHHKNSPKKQVNRGMIADI